MRRGTVRAGIKPGEMGEQQARVEALPFAHRLAPEPDGFGDAMHGAGGQHLFGSFARDDERRLPRGGKGAVAATADIGGLRRHPGGLRGKADIAFTAERFKELRDARRGEHDATRGR